MERELDVNFKQKILQHSASVNPEYWIEYMVPSPYSDTLESTALKLSASTDVVEDEKLLVEEILRTQLQELSSTNNMNSVFGKVCLYLNK